MGLSRFEFRMARAWRRAVFALAALALVVGALWAFTLLDRGETRLAWLALATLPLAAWALRAGRSQAGVLRDEGGSWWLETPAGAARPLAGTLRIAPGDPDRSFVVQRMESTDPLRRMPPLGRTLPDYAGGVRAVRLWAARLDTCP